MTIGSSFFIKASFLAGLAEEAGICLRLGLFLFLLLYYYS